MIIINIIIISNYVEEKKEVYDISYEKNKTKAPE